MSKPLVLPPKTGDRASVDLIEDLHTMIVECYGDPVALASLRECAALRRGREAALSARMGSEKEAAGAQQSLIVYHEMLAGLEAPLGADARSKQLLPFTWHSCWDAGDKVLRSTAGLC